MSCMYLYDIRKHVYPVNPNYYNWIMYTIPSNIIYIILEEFATDPLYLFANVYNILYVLWVTLVFYTPRDTPILKNIKYFTRQIRRNRVLVRRRVEYDRRIAISNLNKKITRKMYYNNCMHNQWWI